MDVIGSVMERPHVKEEISAKYDKILSMLEDEARTSKVSAYEQARDQAPTFLRKFLFAVQYLFEQLTASKMRRKYVVDRHLPPIVVALNTSHSLRQRLTTTMNSFKVCSQLYVRLNSRKNIAAA